GNDDVLQRVADRVSEVKIYPHLRAGDAAGGGITGDGVAGDLNMVPGVPRDQGGVGSHGAAFELDRIQHNPRILDARHHQVADGDIGERLPGGRGELEFRRWALD